MQNNNAFLTYEAIFDRSIGAYFFGPPCRSGTCAVSWCDFVPIAGLFCFMLYGRLMSSLPFPTTWPGLRSVLDDCNCNCNCTTYLCIYMATGDVAKIGCGHATAGRR